MDLQAFYLQAAEAAATVRATAEAGDDVEEPQLPSRRAAVLLRQAVGFGGADAAERLPRHVGKTLTLRGGAAAAGMMADEVREGGSLARVLICPECGKAFQSDKAMYGHLRAHPQRGYKGASRPGTPAAAAAGDARPRKAPPRKEVPELPAIKWPVTARRSRTPTIASRPVSAEPPAVLLLEPPRGVDPVPLQMVPPPAVLLLEPPRSEEPPVLLLEPPRSEEEEAAMTLMDLYQRIRGVASPEPEDQQMHAAAGHQMPDQDQLELPAPADHGAHASHHAPVEHIFGIIVGPQEAEAEQQSNATAAASKGKELLEPEPVNTGALVLFRDKNDKKDKLVPPGPSKRPKKRPLQDLDQRQQPRAAENRLPPLRRIPSPASDRTFMCPMDNCYKTFPSHQALGGHMANHNRNLRTAASQNMDEIAAVHAVQNIIAQHKLRQDALHGENVPPPVSKAPKSHSCSRCDLIFPTGQALGGHMRKHWLEAKMRAAPATALGVPILARAAPANAMAVPVAAVVAPAHAMAVQAAAPAALANALLVPIAAAAAPNGEPRDFEFDLNEMPME